MNYIREAKDVGQTERKETHTAISPVVLYVLCLVGLESYRTSLTAPHVQSLYKKQNKTKHGSTLMFNTVFRANNNK